MRSKNQKSSTSQKWTKVSLPPEVQQKLKGGIAHPGQRQDPPG